jgi:hypothetical protein
MQRDRRAIVPTDFSVKRHALAWRASPAHGLSEALKLRRAGSIAPM